MALEGLAGRPCASRSESPPGIDAQKGWEDMETVATRERVSLHPLDPLTAEEIESAATTLRESDPAFAAARFVSIALDEPTKDQVLSHAGGDVVERRAALVVRDSTARKTYEAVVSLSERRVLSLEHVSEAQTALTE